MIQAGLVSYLTGALAFVVLGLLLLKAWRDGIRIRLLILACAASAADDALLAWHAAGAPLGSGELLAAEAARTGVWLLFLLELLGGQRARALPGGVRFGVHALWLSILIISLARMFADGSAPVPSIEGSWAIGAGLALSLAGLTMIEQVYRNAGESGRWALKFLCLGTGGMFAYDLYLYADGLLFRQIDLALWDARGVIHALIVPLVAISASRALSWPTGLAVSRKLAFFTTTLTAAGVYLVAVALGGYYIRAYGGSWGALVQTVFLFGAVLVLLLVLFSGQVRSRLRVWLAKHLYRYRYDYREEWLRLIRTLSDAGDGHPLPERAVQAVARILESPIGGIWLKRDGAYVPSGGDLAGPDSAVEPASSPFVRFLAEREWVVNVDAERGGPGVAGLEPPRWLLAMERAWLVVPLLHASELTGFIVLAQPRVAQRLEWEEFDLLKTVGRQVAVDLAQYEAARRLSEAEQFQAYHRFAAFMMHDLKNVVAQLSLVVSNAGRFKHRPEFIDDALATVDNTVQRMTRLLEQLRRGEENEPARRTGLVALCRSVAERLAQRDPAPSLAATDGEVFVRVSPERLSHVLEHVIRNAQEATSPDGVVGVSVTAVDATAQLVVEDDGCGMDARFVRQRLFRPFDTTKGSRGMGIGAYEAREYVRQAGGEVSVDSAPGRGTRFIITLPLAGAGQNTGADGNPEAVDR